MIRWKPSESFDIETGGRFLSYGEKVILRKMNGDRFRESPRVDQILRGGTETFYAKSRSEKRRKKSPRIGDPEASWFGVGVGVDRKMHRR